MFLPRAAFVAAVRLRQRPAPWQVVPKERSIDRNDHRLAHTAVAVGDVVMTGGKGPRRPLAMHADTLARVAHLVPFELRDVVGHVIEELHAKRVPRFFKHPGKHLPHLPHEQLPVAEGVVGGGPHGTEIMLPLRALDRCTDQLPVGQSHAVFRRGVAEGP
jgi:hypothetical protein